MMRPTHTHLNNAAPLVSPLRRGEYPRQTIRLTPLSAIPWGEVSRPKELDMRRTLALIALMALLSTPVMADDAATIDGNFFEDLVEWVTELFGPFIDPGGEPSDADFGPILEPGG